MTALIRGMPDLIVGIRAAVRERNVAYETVDDISGLPDRYTAKVLAPKPIKNLGYQSIGELLGALGKALVLVDDPEQIERVQARWRPRKRPFKPAASDGALKREEIPVSSQQVQGLTRMQILGRAGGMASGKKRRAQAMRRRELQRKRSHAARLRWARSKG